MAQQVRFVKVQVVLAAGILMLYKLLCRKSILDLGSNHFLPLVPLAKELMWFPWLPFLGFPEEIKFFMNFGNDCSENELEMSRYTRSGGFQWYIDRKMPLISLYCLLSGVSLRTAGPCVSRPVGCFSFKVCPSSTEVCLAAIPNLGGDFFTVNQDFDIVSC